MLEEALELERIDEAGAVVWVGDGAPCNWTLADELAPDAVQILAWYHAVENAMKCGKVVLGEERAGDIRRREPGYRSRTDTSTTIGSARS